MCQQHLLDVFDLNLQCLHYRRMGFHADHFGSTERHLVNALVCQLLSRVSIQFNDEEVDCSSSLYSPAGL
ncbi:hypothetical protein CAter282_0400 [Collimonas arenae]|uniref:Uncharacterized protein n=1 Tax=Collimonas arenae TaxID=279058 RepID=A0A127QDZ0_9BURK|nr:hypothetical protein CAter10_0428 [Collimonas arenae]AMP08216.1 hypothetical protein CAter282_0400 [Collimonas arenae]